MQTTTPNIPPLSFFTGRMPFLTPNQQRQSAEGKGKQLINTTVLATRVTSKYRVRYYPVCLLYSDA